MSAAPRISGVLVIDKPRGATSMDACRRVKAALIAGGAPRSVKVGHGGTLDPLATGVVVVLVGGATKRCGEVMAGEKRYQADVDLAHTSPTDDLEGALTPVAGTRPPTREEVERACRKFEGVIEQRPPAHSAIWVDGTRSYKLARRGRAVDLPARNVEIHEINVVRYAWPRLTLDVRCGKGTYIRSLARDLGASLGVGGVLAALRRTAVGAFTVDRAVPLDALPGRLDPSALTAG